jgi:hypothetical protein
VQFGQLFINAWLFVDIYTERPSVNSMNKTTNQISVAIAAKLLGVNNRTIHRRIIRGDFKLVTKFEGLRGPYILNRQEIQSLVDTK